MRAALLAALLSLLPAAAPAAEPDDSVKVTVTRDESGWTADYLFARDAPAWIFARSEVTREEGEPWRPQAWTIETPGVRIEHHGFHDVLTADGTVPRSVRIRFRPFGEDLKAGYEPAMIFSDGRVGIFSSQFDVAPLEAASAADALPYDFEASGVAGVPALITFRDPEGPVLYAGKRYPALTLQAAPTYVIFGPGDPLVSPDLNTILDPGLPEWIRISIGTETPRLLAHYAAHLGERMGDKPTVMATWAGPTSGKTSMGGSVLPGLVIMTFEGDRVLEPSKAAHDFFQWFIAHESAHFWLGETVSYDLSDHAWMMEGGADLLAVRAIAAIDPTYDPRPRLNNAIAQCETFAAKPIDSANARGEQDAYYACGAVFGLIAESAMRRVRPDADFFDFWRALIDGSRDDRVVGKDEWLAQLTKVSHDASLAHDIEEMTDKGVADPRATIASLFSRSGVRYELDAEGRPRF